MPGGTAPYLVSMDSLSVGVRLLPLLSGRLEVAQVTLGKPVINLEADKQGNGNWVLGGKSAPAKAASPAETAGGGVAAAARAKFQGVRIKDGTVSYHDAKTGKTRSLEHIDLTVGITSLDQPLTLDGSLVAEGQTISLDGRIDSLKALMDGTATPVDLSLTSKLVQASFKGALARDGGDGVLKLDTPSLRQLAAWAGSPLAPGGGLGRLSLEGKLSARRARPTASRRSSSCSTRSRMTGAMRVDRSGAVPFVSGHLAVDRLNLNPYLASGAAPMVRHGAEAGAGHKRLEQDADRPFAAESDQRQADAQCRRAGTAQTETGQDGTRADAEQRRAGRQSRSRHALWRQRRGSAAREFRGRRAAHRQHAATSRTWRSSNS